MSSDLLKCPKCGRLSEYGVEACDCGYSFVTRLVSKPSALTVDEQPRGGWHYLSLLIAVCLGTLAIKAQLGGLMIALTVLGGYYLADEAVTSPLRRKGLRGEARIRVVAGVALGTVLATLVGTIALDQLRITKDATPTPRVGNTALATTTVEDADGASKVENVGNTVIAATTVEDADGASPADFNLAGLRRIEEVLVDRMIEGTRVNLVKAGHEDVDVTPHRSESVIVDVDGAKLGVIRYESGTLSIAWIIGFVQDGIARVTCLQNDGDRVVVTQGECAREIRKTFGVTL